MGTYDSIPPEGSPSWQNSVDTFANFPAGTSVGEARTAEDTQVIYIWDGAVWVPVNAGATPVTSVNGATGAVVLTAQDINAGTANSFVRTDAAGDLDVMTGWTVDPGAVRTSSVDLTFQPDNVPQGGYTPHYWRINVDPLQASPNDSINAHSFNLNLDSAATGFSYGTSGEAASILSSNYNYQGNGSTYGSLVHYKMNSTFGNGIDPVTVKGHNYLLGYGNFSANATLDGAIQGYGFQPALNAATITTSNASVNAFYDFAQMPVTIYGYSTLVANPTIGTIANSFNYNGVNLNPTVTTLTGNASAVLFGAYGTYTTLGATSGVQGFNFNPTITTMGATSYCNGANIGGTITTGHGNIFGVTVNQTVSGGDANYDGVSISTSNITTTGTKAGLRIGGAAGSLTDTAIESSNGHHNMFYEFEVPTAAAGGQFIGNSIGGSIIIPDATAVTGTDVIGNSFAYVIHTGDATSSYVKNGFGLAMVGFAGLIDGDGDVDDISACLGGYAAGITGGTINRINNFNAACFDIGVTGTITEIVNFYGHVLTGSAFATTHWGCYMQDDFAHNYFAGDVVVGTSATPTNASVGVEINSVTKALLLSRMTTTERNALTAVDGMILYNTTLSKVQVYEGGAWVSVI